MDKTTTTNEAHPILLCCISPLPVQFLSTALLRQSHVTSRLTCIDLFANILTMPNKTWSKELMDTLGKVGLVRRAIMDAVVLNPNLGGVFVDATSCQVIQNARIRCCWWQADLTHCLPCESCEVVEGHLCVDVAHCRRCRT